MEIGLSTLDKFYRFGEICMDLWSGVGWIIWNGTPTGISFFVPACGYVVCLVAEVVDDLLSTGEVFPPATLAVVAGAPNTIPGRTTNANATIAEVLFNNMIICRYKVSNSTSNYLQL